MTRALALIACVGLATTVLSGCNKDKKETPKAAAVATKTLWDRLGGEANVRKVVDDFVGRAAGDPKVNFFRKNVAGYPEWKPSGEQVNNLKQRLVELISANTGGPFKYGGKDMKSSHAGMKVTEAEFNALAGHLDAALKAGGALDADRAAVMGVAAGTAKDIVEVK
ncbi:MAG: group I truncated hemoglobin [Phycisphaerales bacterium]